MEVSFFVVADYANISKDNKLNVMGIFSNINSVSFPATHAEMYVIAQLTASAAEYGRVFKLGIKLINEDAMELVNFVVDATVPSQSQGLRSSMNNILRLTSVVFEAPGTYEFALMVDQDVKATIAVEVNQMPVEGMNG